jgi:hypothetical protein
MGAEKDQGDYGQGTTVGKPRSVLYKNHVEDDGAEGQYIASLSGTQG